MTEARRTMRQAIRESFQYRELLWNLTQRELRSRYRRSFLGWGWSLLQPAMMTAVYAVVLGSFFKVRPAPGDPSGIHNFAIFLLAAMLPWNLLAAGLPGGMGTIANGGSLISRVWFPREIMPLSTILAMTISMLIEMGVLAVFIVVLTGHLMIHLLPVLLVIVILQIGFVSGLTYWLAAVNVRFRDVEYITSVFLLAYFYLSPVVYAPSFVPATKLIGSLTTRDVYKMNPMSQFIQAYRDIFYNIRIPLLTNMLYLVVAAAVTLFLGLRFFVRRSDRFAEAM